MPQIVELPDGATVEFPDGMSEETMSRLVDNEFGPDSLTIKKQRAQLQAEMEQERSRIGPKFAALTSDIGERAAYAFSTLRPRELAQIPENIAKVAGVIPMDAPYAVETPIVAPGTVVDPLKRLVKPLPGSFGEAAVEFVGETAESMTSPLMGSMLVAGGTTPIQRIFQGEMLAAVPESLQQVATAEPGKERQKAGLAAGANILLPGAIELNIRRQTLPRTTAAATETIRPEAEAKAEAAITAAEAEGQMVQIRPPAQPQPVRPPPVEVPETPATPYRAVLGEIRDANATTIRQIQELFPQAQLSREQARVLRNQAWPEQQIIETRAPTTTQERIIHEETQKEAEVLTPEAGKEPTPAAAVPPPETTAPATATGEIKSPATAESPAAAEPSTPISTTPVEITQGPGTGVGPGAAAVREFSEIAAESNRGVFGRLVDWIKSKRTPETDQIKEAVQQKDVMAGRQWLNSPEYLFRKDPKVAPFVSRIIESQLRHTDRAGRDEIHFQEITKRLPKENLKNITTALREYEAGDLNALTAKLTPDERVVAEDIRTYYDQWKDRIRQRRVDNIIAALPDARGRTVQAILKGQPLEAASKANKLRGPGKEAVKLAIKEIEDARKWGIDRYVTHSEQGSWRIVTEDGTTIAVAETKPDAYLKAQAYLKENPKSGPLTLDDSFNPGVDWPSQLTLPAYGKLLKQLKDATGETAAELQTALRKTAPGIVLKPTSKYNRFLQRRFDVLKGEENIMDVLPSYIYSMWKKHELDPVLKEAQTALPKMAPETRSAVEALLGDVKGQKYLGDKIVDSILSGAADMVQNTTGFMLPVKPFAYSRGVNVLRSISAQLKLGYRPISILVNRLGGIHHTWTKTGFRDYLEGRKWSKTEEGKRLIKENEAEMGLQAAFVTEGRLTREEPWYKPLGLFQKMEHFNRPEAFGAFYVQATKRMGLSGPDAIQYARNATRFAQFTYNTASLPKIMRGPTGRLIFQFKPYLVKELEFISNLRGAEVARYMTGFLLLGGPRAAIMMLRSLPFLGAFGVLGALEDWLNQEAPRASRGAPGFVGADISAAVTPQLPRTETDWIGPALSDYLRLWNDIISPAMRGEDKDWSDIKNWASRTAPTFFYLTQMSDAIMDEQGWITDDRGRKQFQADRWDKAKLALGVTPLDKSIESSERRFLIESEEIQRKNRTKWVDNLVDALQDNNSKKFQSLLEDASDYYTSTDDLMTAIRNNLKNRITGPKERLFQRLSRASRLREMDRFFEPEEPLQPEESSVP